MRRHRALAVIAASLILFASQAGDSSRFIASEFSAVTESPETTQAWLEGLRERGYVVGGNLQIEYRYSQGPDRADPRARG